MLLLSEVKEFHVPPELVEQSQSFLRLPGTKGYEGIVLWAGRVLSESGIAIAKVLSAVMPAQEGLRSEDGLLAMVDGAELFRLNRSLSEQGLTLVAQLHSHPGEAYHSYTDDRFALVTASGALSIVVPDFALGPFKLEDCAVYRLGESGTWHELNSVQASRLIRFRERSRSERNR